MCALTEFQAFLCGWYFDIYMSGMVKSIARTKDIDLFRETTILSQFLCNFWRHYCRWKLGKYSHLENFFYVVVALSLPWNSPVKLFSLIHALKTCFFEISVFTLRLISRCLLVLLDNFRISGTDTIHPQGYSNDLFYSTPEVLDGALGKQWCSLIWICYTIMKGTLFP